MSTTHANHRGRARLPYRPSGSLAPGVAADAYWNVTKGLWSVRVQARVVAHLPSLTLTHAHFHVSEAGRQRVLRSKRKNVHAWVWGYVCACPVAVEGARRVSYNPYKGAAVHHR